MRCWSEVENDPYSLGFFDKDRAEQLLGYVPKLRMLSLVGERLFCLEDSEKFKRACFMNVDTWLRGEEYKSHKYYLYAILPISTPDSRVARYKKLWKVLQQSWNLQDFTVGPEVEVISQKTLHFAGIAECNLDTLPLALTIMMRNSNAFVFASKRSGVLEAEQVKSLHNTAFNTSNAYPGNVNTFNLCLKLCPRGDIVFRWADASEEEELDLIFSRE